jgi:hypothetical protein
VSSLKEAIDAVDLSTKQISELKTNIYTSIENELIFEYKRIFFQRPKKNKSNNNY